MVGVDFGEIESQNFNLSNQIKILVFKKKDLDDIFFHFLLTKPFESFFFFFVLILKFFF